ncbi:MAG: gliding motility protein GldL [Bacteroidota bacterium]
MAHSLPIEESFMHTFYKSIMPKIYGIGAAIVIAGAMFKLLNWSGGALMLGVGLTTEAIIFFLSAFEPPAKELDWTKVYPQLAHEGDGGSAIAYGSSTQGPVAEKLDEMFAQAKIDAALIERLGKGMQQLSDSMANVNAIPNVSEATQQYVKNLNKVSEVLNTVYETHAHTTGAIENIVNAAQQAQAYQEQVQSATESLSALNAAYMNELQAVDLRTRTTQEVYSDIVASMEEMQTTSEETAQFKTELGQLSQKISSLNSIYGNMLTALKN